MTTGEGGAITTNNEEIFDRLISLRNHGREKTKWGYEHGCLGYNYRMTDIAAAIGLVQLKHLPNFIKKRRENANYYHTHIIGVETPHVLSNVVHVYHQYTVKYAHRDELISRLKENDIGFGIYYPKPLHFYSHLKKFAHNRLINSEDLAKTVLSLPIHPALNDADLERVVDVVNGVCQPHNK
jgi:perosamine synthetase